MGIPVKDVAPTLEPIDLPRGRKDLPVREFNFALAALKTQMQQATTEEESVRLERQLLHGLVPDITDAEIDDLAPGEKLWIIMYCGRRLEEVLAALKNVEGAAVAAEATSPSAPTTRSSTPSPASPAPSGRTGSRRRTARSGRPSTPSIG